MLSTCPSPSVTTTAFPAAFPAAAPPYAAGHVAPVNGGRVLAARGSASGPLPDPLARASGHGRPAAPAEPDPVAAPAAPRARFRRLVVFDGRLA